MIKPIYAQQRSKHGHIGRKLKEALIWWRTVLVMGVAEAVPWHTELSCPVHLFVDAASTPPRCAAVLVVDGVFHYTDVRPPQEWFGCLNWRNDNQIMTLEIAAIRVALCTFVNEIAGRKVILYSDNVGAEKATAHGSAKAFDHNALIHEIWMHVFIHKIKLWIERVPSKFNISDSPSRFEYKILEDLGAVWKRADVINSFTMPEGYSCAQLRH